MVIEKSSILKVLSKTETLYVADYNDTYGVSTNMIKKLFQFSSFGKSLNLGNIVLEQVADGEYIVVEGIQKLVTLSLILFALCECYKQTNTANEEAISKIYERYLLGKYGVKLNLNDVNKDIYEKIIYKEKLTDEEKENPLFVVLHKFWEEIKEECISANELYKLLKAIDCYIIHIKQGEGLDFYYNLNKNNSRLDTTKLIRSYLKRMNEPLLYIWDEMVDKYIELDIYDMLQPFIKDFLSIQNSKISMYDAEVFAFFVAYYEDSTVNKTPEFVLKNISEFSKRYIKMIKLDFEYFDIRKKFSLINEIGGQIAYPYLLEVLTDYENNKLSTDALNLILKTVYDYLYSGHTFDFARLSELINQRLVLRKINF